MLRGRSGGKHPPASILQFTQQDGRRSGTSHVVNKITRPPAHYDGVPLGRLPLDLARGKPPLRYYLDAFVKTPSQSNMSWTRTEV